MQEWFRIVIGNARTLIELEERIVAALFVWSQQSAGLCYVSGIISSDGPARIAENIQKLQIATEEIRCQLDIPVFCAPEIFSNEVFEQINASALTEDDWYDFWDRILSQSGVTRVYMTKGWQRSNGARREYQMARQLDLEVCFCKGAEIAG